MRLFALRDHTRSKVFFARSLTAQRAMIGILSEAVRDALLLASRFWLKSDLDMIEIVTVSFETRA